ncbi:MAG: hypothetical protein HYT07_00445 [Candidatus Levybacteria bacterium]|nr:hypothetical protein [Candidatus Levybacteria bacterium]
MKFIKNFNEININDITTVGGKGASLGELSNAGFPVPSGFVITTYAYQQFYNQELPVDVEEKILKAFDELDAKRVAVRSSAVAEDSSSASWAGQLETYLNVTKDNLIENVRKCWNSIKSERMLSYAAQQDLSEDKMIVAVIVQKMVESAASGVMFTANPISKDRNEIMLEAGYGLGEMLVQGFITPNNFIVDKKTFRIKSRDIQSQENMLVFKDGQNKEIPVPESKRNKQAISNDEVVELAKMAIKIEKHFGNPQDIEWAIDDKSKVWIVQSRPITTL